MLGGSGFIFSREMLLRIYRHFKEFPAWPPAEANGAIYGDMIISSLIHAKQMGTMVSTTDLRSKWPRHYLPGGGQAQQTGGVLGRPMSFHYLYLDEEIKMEPGMSGPRLVFALANVLINTAGSIN